MSLRNPNINYEYGWFFVTTQVAHNKTMLGVISDDKCLLNELGRRIESSWQGLFERHPEAYRDEFVVMPNHFHAVIRIHKRPANKPNHLSYLMQSFKSFATHLYHGLARAGKCPDIGSSLWQSSYYDNLITSRQELDNIRAYIRNNPACWDNDRFGPVTSYHLGNLELLQGPLVAYVASEGEWDTEVPPHDSAGGMVLPGGHPSRATGAVLPGGHPSRATGAVLPGGHPSRAGGAVLPGGHPSPATGAVLPGGQPSRATGAVLPGGHPSRGAGPPCPAPAVISTFTSPQERALLAQCLARQRPYIHLLPGGIPEPLPPQWQAACTAGAALLLSPVPSGTGINKQRAIWCNRYVLDQANEVRHGYIRPGGTLETLLQRGRGVYGEPMSRKQEKSYDASMSGF